MKSIKTSNEKVSETTSKLKGSVKEKKEGGQLKKSKPRSTGNPDSSSHAAALTNGHEAQPVQAIPWSVTKETELQERIAKRAYELYEQRGRHHGQDIADWFQATQEILTEKGVV
jgi:hypothetical protein